MNIIRTANKVIQFLKDVAGDARIPDRDKKIILTLIVLIVSPIDIIPDWIPFFGLMDDFVLAAIILDYYFRVVDPEVLLHHYPFGMKSFSTLKKLARMTAFLVPQFITRRVWKYAGSPYRTSR